ncbi:hypothetical protein [Celerinatantimonas sp. MCCC 1A17872]|uniref:hypothetical protein n=1 Tax=Celerinatantimonas sp. MCCC 1A17872 TaxID=3177514 RepID=UPI0038C4D942
MRINKILQLTFLLALFTVQAKAAESVKISSLSADDLNFTDCPTDAFTLASLNAKALNQPLPKAAMAQIKRSGALLVTNLNSKKAPAQTKDLLQQLGANWQLKLSRVVNGFQSALFFRPSELKTLGTFNQAAGFEQKVWVILAQANGQSLTLVSTIHGPYQRDLLAKQTTLIQRHQAILSGDLPKLTLMHHYQYQQQTPEQSLLSRGLNSCASSQIALAKGSYLQWLSISFGP